MIQVFRTVEDGERHGRKTLDWPGLFPQPGGLVPANPSSALDSEPIHACERKMANSNNPKTFRELKSPGSGGQKKFDFSQGALQDGHIRTRAFALGAQRATLLKTLKDVVSGNSSMCDYKRVK